MFDPAPQLPVAVGHVSAMPQAALPALVALVNPAKVGGSAQVPVATATLHGPCIEGHCPATSKEATR